MEAFYFSFLENRETSHKNLNQETFMASSFIGIGWFIFVLYFNAR